MSDHMNRRDFVRLGAMAGLTTATAGCATSGQIHKNIGPAPAWPFSVAPIETVKIGFVGVGGMGTAHCRNLLRIDGCEIRAVCDIVPDKCKNVQKLAKEAGKPIPKEYSKGEYDFVRMCETEDLDLVYTATPWNWHVPVLVAAMKNGKHGATEVPAANTLEECWEMVETAEKYQKHCVMMENCCYGRVEMQVLNMVRKGVFGELLHAECGYLHDLRGVKFSKGGEGLWRREHSKHRDGNLYATHGLGPVSQCMNINRGDQYDYLVSMSSNSRGLQLWRDERLPKNDPRRKETYKLGDVNTTLIKTKLGRTIKVVHDTNLPRPYSRINLVQGTRAITRDYPARIHIEGKTEGHGWEPLNNYKDKYDHPMWKALESKAVGAGHGGMDFLEDFRLIQNLNEGNPLDQDVYDAAAWSSIGELSEISVADRSNSVDCPDFTRGKWKTNAPLGIIEI